MNYKALLLEHFGLPEDATDEAIQRIRLARARLP